MFFLERPELPASDTGFKRQTSSSDCSSQMSTTEDRSRGSEDGATLNSEKTVTERVRKSPIVEVSSVTGLRKTNYSETLYGDKKTALSMMEKKHTRNSSSPPICLDGNDSPSASLQKSGTSSRIPHSPVLNRRRLSMENLSSANRSRSASRDRSAMLRDRSVSRDTSSPVKRPSTAGKAKDSASKPPVPVNSPTHGGHGSFGKVAGSKLNSAINNTWNGRSPVPKGKNRPTVTADTFMSPLANKSPAAANKVSSPPFQRNSNLRSSTSALRNMNGYDHNGRRIQVKPSPQTSPVKTSSKLMSPLLEKILKTAENAEDDMMMLEKMKDIIKQYSGLVQGSEKSRDAKQMSDDPDYSDFTSAWVHSNGTLERSQSSRQLRDSLNNCSVPTSKEAETVDTSDSALKSAALVSKIPMFSPRRDCKSVGITSRIPAPVSSGSYKKSSDYYE